MKNKTNYIAHLQKSKSTRGAICFHKKRSRLAALQPRTCALALSLLTALTLMHCGNDEGRFADSDGGGPAPNLSAIYLWVTACKTKGDMSACGSSGSTGLAKANSICQKRYAADVSATHRARIKGEGKAAPEHRALLAFDPAVGGLPQAFPIRGKDSLKIKRPDGSTVISNSWADFFNAAKNALQPIDSSATIQYYTGLYVSGVGFIKGNNCNNWSSDAVSTSDASTRTITGTSDNVDSSRLYLKSTDRLCSGLHNLLCITH